MKNNRARIRALMLGFLILGVSSVAYAHSEHVACGQAYDDEANGRNACDIAIERADAALEAACNNLGSTPVIIHEYAERFQDQRGTGCGYCIVYRCPMVGRDGLRATWVQ